MTDMKKLLHTFDEADELLNGKINRTNLSTIVASATASVENKKTVLIRGTGRNIESLKVGGRTVQDGVPTPDAPVEVKGVGDKVENLFSGSFSQFTNTGGSGDLYSYFKLPKSGSYTLTIEPKSTFEVVGDIYLGFTEKGGLAKDGSTDARYTWIVSPGKTFTKEKKVSVTSNFEYISMYKKLESALTYLLENFNIMLEYGSKSSPYIPYGSTKYKIPVSCNGETTNIYLDTPLFDGEAADLVSGKATRIGDFYVLNGNEPWSIQSTETNTIQFTYNTGVKHLGECSCSHFPYKTGSDDSAHIRFSGSANINVSVWCPKTIVSSVETFKTWLSNNNVVLYGKFLTEDMNTTDIFDGAAIPTTAAEQEVNINTELVPSSIEAVTFGDYYTKSEVSEMVNDLQPMFYSSLDTNKVRVTFDSFPTDRIYLINIRFTVDGNTFVCNLSSPRNSVNSQYFTTFTRYGGKNHTVTGYLNLALENKEVIATLLNVELDGESIANPTITRLILSCIK